MRTTITIEDDIFQAAQSLASASGKRLGEVISQLARKGLRADPDIALKNGIPVFKVSSNAMIIPSDRATRLLADDIQG